MVRTVKSPTSSRRADDSTQNLAQEPTFPHPPQPPSTGANEHGDMLSSTRRLSCPTRSFAEEDNGTNRREPPAGGFGSARRRPRSSIYGRLPDRTPELSELGEVASSAPVSGQATNPAVQSPLQNMPTSQPPLYASQPSHSLVDQGQQQPLDEPVLSANNKASLGSHRGLQDHRRMEDRRDVEGRRGVEDHRVSEDRRSFEGRRGFEDCRGSEDRRGSSQHHDSEDHRGLLNHPSFEEKRDFEGYPRFEQHHGTQGHQSFDIYQEPDEQVHQPPPESDYRSEASIPNVKIGPKEEREDVVRVVASKVQKDELRIQELVRATADNLLFLTSSCRK